MAKKVEKKPDKKGSDKKGKVLKKDNMGMKDKPERIILSKQRPVPAHIDLTKESKDFKNVIRISNKDIPGYLTIKDGLMSIYGIDNRMGKVIEDVFIRKVNKPIKKIGYLTDDDVVILEDLIINIDKEVPKWLINRQNCDDGIDYKQAHLTMSDLKLAQRKEIQKLGKTKSYRGLRLQWGLPVRGQRTRSTFRKSSAVGVTKKKEGKK